MAVALLVATGAPAAAPRAQDAGEPLVGMPSQAPIYYFRRNGRLVGAARRSGSVYLFYGEDGDLLGAARDFGGTTLFFREDGRPDGALRRRPQAVDRFDADGRLAETARGAPGTTLFVDGDGAIVGGQRQLPAPQRDPSDTQTDLELPAYAGGVGRTP
ncbi:MAG: hypothetical protein U1E14_13685 [Geminicoccaceae bacterium]